MSSSNLPVPGISGWLVINKPLGVSSAHVVAVVKRLVRPYGKPKVGHAGTLDPMASGVLPIAIGEATKVAQYLIDSSKEYSFEVTWGQERDTDDAVGAVINSSKKRPSRAELEKILPKFRGDISQVPPQYSAIKVEGKRAYDTARKGGETELKARHVKIYMLELKEENGNAATFNMGCSKGTYVRSLARDMGRELGCFGYVSKLHRTRQVLRPRDGHALGTAGPRRAGLKPTAQGRFRNVCPLLRGEGGRAKRRPGEGA